MADDSLGSLVAKLVADVTDLKKGLLDGKGELAGFKTYVSDTVSQVKGLLKFAGVSLGFYELISQAKEFGKAILEEGGKVELLRASADAIANYYGMSAASVEVYIEKLKEKGITEASAYQATSQFLKAGISVDKLPQLADDAKVLGASMGLPLQEAFDKLVQGIVKGTPKQLAEMVPGIKEVLQSMSSETKKLLDSSIISGTEKAEILMNATHAMAEKLKGSVDSVSDSYYTKLNEYKAKVAEVKEALFALVKPIGMAITQEEIKSWDDFYSAVGKNKAALKELGETIAGYVTEIGSWARSIASFAAQHKDLIGFLIEIRFLVAAMKWTGIAAGAEAISAVLVKVGLLRVALSGPWQLVIVATLVGADLVMRQAAALSKTHPEYVGGAEWVPSEEYKAGGLAAGRKEQDQAFIASHKGLKAGAVSPFGGLNPTDEERAAQAKREAEEARKKGAKDHALPGGGGKGGGGAEEDILGEHMKALEAQRKADLAAAADQIQLLKATLDQKRALLAQDLATGKIDGAEYYQKLQDLEKQETAAALAEIAKKRQAQKAAYADELTVLAQQQAQGKFSPEMGAEKSAALAAKNRQEMAKLDMDAAKTKLDGEKKITEELTKQLELKKQYTQTTEDLNMETAQLMGAISSQEATLQKLVLDWKRTKAEAFKAGVMDPNSPAFVPGYGAALDKNLEAKKTDTLYGGYSTQITQGISSLVDSLTAGGQDLQKVANNMFKGLFNEALKPGLDQLKNLLTQGFKDVFGASGAAISSAVMGVIGLVGMLLTSSSKSSFSASGVQSGVTTHEAVRGVIAGQQSVAIADIATSLSDALLPTNDVLSQIEINTRGGLKASVAPANMNVSISMAPSDLVSAIKDAVSQAIAAYFANGLMKGGATV
jgi:DNA-binding transcriptional ArsR family regulator